MGNRGPSGRETQGKRDTGCAGEVTLLPEENSHLWSVATRRRRPRRPGGTGAGPGRGLFCLCSRGGLERYSEHIARLSRVWPPPAEPPPPELRRRLPPLQAAVSPRARRLRHGDPQLQRGGEQLGPPGRGRGGGGGRPAKRATRSAAAGRGGSGKPGGAGGGRRVPARDVRQAGRRGGRLARCGLGAPGRPWQGGPREGGEGGNGVLVDLCRWGACCGEWAARASSGMIWRAAGRWRGGWRAFSGEALL